MNTSGVEWGIIELFSPPAACAKVWRARRPALTRWMGLGDVDHKEVTNPAEVLDELLELVKSVHERGSSATSKTQHQRLGTCRETRSSTPEPGSTRGRSRWRTSHVLTDARFPAVHGDHRWVGSVSSHKRLLAETHPHVPGCECDVRERLKRRTPVLVLKPGILGHGDLFTHSEDVLLAEARWNKTQDPHRDAESYHVAKRARCRKVQHHFLHKHVAPCRRSPVFTASLEKQSATRSRSPPTPPMFDNSCLQGRHVSSVWSGGEGAFTFSFIASSIVPDAFLCVSHLWWKRCRYISGSVYSCKSQLIVHINSVIIHFIVRFLFWYTT